jgi:hypothetical protein
MKCPCRRRHLIMKFVYILLNIFFGNGTRDHGEFSWKLRIYSSKHFDHSDLRGLIYRTFYGLFIIVQISRKNYAFEIPRIYIPRILSGAVCLMLQSVQCLRRYFDRITPLNFHANNLYGSTFSLQCLDCFFILALCVGE